jgi:flavodoxin
MACIVICGSRTGNARMVAGAIADALGRLGDVRLVAAADAAAVQPHAGELLVLGGPTVDHQMTPDVAECLDRMAPGDLTGVTAAAFDTRLGMPRWPSGVAATAIATRLRQLGARVIEPESRFIVAGQPPALVPGELDRAREWAAALAEVAAPARRSGSRGFPPVGTPTTAAPDRSRSSSSQATAGHAQRWLCSPPEPVWPLRSAAWRFWRWASMKRPLASAA